MQDIQVVTCSCLGIERRLGRGQATAVMSMSLHLAFLVPVYDNTGRRIYKESFAKEDNKAL